MKVERGENKIVLIPESEFEVNCMKEMRRRQIRTMDFQDSWNQSGGLEVEFQDVNDWGNQR